ncbi:MAG: hypothetical protein U1F43_05910 [Myxococcota bacterium]
MLQGAAGARAPRAETTLARDAAQANLLEAAAEFDAGGQRRIVDHESAPWRALARTASASRSSGAAIGHAPQSSAAKASTTSAGP